MVPLSDPGLECDSPPCKGARGQEAALGFIVNVHSSENAPQDTEG